MFDNKETFKLSHGRGSAPASEHPVIEDADFDYSSVLASARYIPSSLTLASLTLELTFKSGKVYRYEGVEPWVFESLIMADSPGQFFSHEIKGKYPCQQIN